jgi:hypothetical protein
LLTTGEVIDAAVGLLGKTRYWRMYGRAEFGPARGNRSILASPLVLDREFESVHQAPRAFRTCRVGSGKWRRNILSRGECAFLATVGSVRPAAIASRRILAGDLVRVHAVSEEDNPLYWKLPHAQARRPACRCSTIPRST